MAAHHDPRGGAQPAADALVGVTRAIARVRSDVAYAVDSDVPVLLSGEPGVGKSEIARLIHDGRDGSRRQLVGIDCRDGQGERRAFEAVESYRERLLPYSGLPDIGAPRRPCAQTLYLSHVEHLGAAMQDLLFAFLGAGRRVRHVGVDRSVRTRIVASATPALFDRVAAGTFRPDLLYRLNVVHVAVPPLRDRREDIPVLLDHVAARAGRGAAASLSAAERERLLAYDWPGNIVELRRVVVRRTFAPRGAQPVSASTAADRAMWE